MIKLIIFDWDDVITIGSKEGYFSCYNSTLKNLGINIDPKEAKKRILSKWGRTHQESISELLKEHPLLIEKACQIYEAHLLGNTFVEALTILPGTNELLRRLSEKYKLCITTGVHKTVFKKKVIPRFKIPEVFSQIIFAEEIESAKQKPDTYTLDAILKQQSIKPEEAVMVGDAESDILMAIKAKVEPIVVLTGHLNKQAAERLGVKKIINSILDLEKVID